MVKKLDFLKKCNRALVSSGFTQSGADATVRVLNKIRLNSLKDSSEVPEDIVQKCISVLTIRVKVMKGDQDGENFLKNISEVISK